MVKKLFFFHVPQGFITKLTRQLTAIGLPVSQMNPIHTLIPDFCEIEIKLPLCLINHHAIKIYGEL
jgi:hypothetical protein